MFFFPFLLSINRLLSISEINKLLLEIFSERKVEEGELMEMGFPGSEIVTKLLNTYKKEPVIIPKRSFYYNKVIDVTNKNLNTNISTLFKILQQHNIPMIRDDKDSFLNLASQTSTYLTTNNSQYNSIAKDIIDRMKKITQTQKYNLTNLETIVLTDRDNVLKNIENTVEFKKTFEKMFGIYNELNSALAVREQNLSFLNPCFQQDIKEKQTVDGLEEVLYFWRFINQTELLYNVFIIEKLSFEECLTLFQDYGKKNPFCVKVNDQLLPQQLGILNVISEGTYKICQPNFKEGQGDIILKEQTTKELILLEVKIPTTNNFEFIKRSSIKKIINQAKEEPFPLPVLLTIFPTFPISSYDDLTNEFKEYVDSRKTRENLVLDLRVKIKQFKNKTW